LIFSKKKYFPVFLNIQENPGNTVRNIISNKLHSVIKLFL
jgi:hypothetical protein